MFDTVIEAGDRAEAEGGGNIVFLSHLADCLVERGDIEGSAVVQSIADHAADHVNFNDHGGGC